MSQPRFAPITADLLARKGMATPSAMMPRHEFVRHVPPPPPREEPEPALQQETDSDHPPHDPARPKKLFIAMTHREHEQLAIAAVKTGLSKHRLVRDALEIYFEQLALDMGDDCPCVTSGFGCRAGCGFD
ncbi:MAG TPA: hypothetical protein VG867_00015 [Rhizomicrobium sp.]|nr:hypothetical protein [Rhizomicrobium sp.]